MRRKRPHIGNQFAGQAMLGHFYANLNITSLCSLKSALQHRNQSSLINAVGKVIQRQPECIALGRKTLGQFAYRLSGYGMVESACQTRLQYGWNHRSEEHTSELQSLMRISYACFFLEK